MNKNIVILSDGTGQAGGINFDEDRSNIYKLYRATRVGPDSLINPAEQSAFYDPGLGSVADGGGMLTKLGRWIYNAISQATGLGITANLIDCYAALIRLWRPGDRVFLFGFSRGAYTIRSLATVVALCGIPTQEKGGGKIMRDWANSRRLAKIAVRDIYQYTYSKREDYASPRELELMKQREALAARFQRDYASASPTNSSLANVYPHFIGAFDTVSSIATRSSLSLLLGGVLLLQAALTAIFYLILQYWTWLASLSIFSFFASLNWQSLFELIFFITIAGIFLRFLFKSIRYAFGLKDHPFWRTIHLTQFKQEFRDLDLNPNVGYARHAISIDENRADFPRVPWGYRDAKHAHAARDTSGNYWFQQVWFPGNHADIGGGYPENEARLSDAALKWMCDEAKKVDLKVDETVIHLWPAHDGMQHDEVAAGFSFLPHWIKKTWASGYREIPNSQATVHDSVPKRFECDEVLIYNRMRRYRPYTLREHDNFKKYYLAKPIPATPQRPLSVVNSNSNVPPPTNE
jgi:uncharacterized protein (DUF2235 family)